MHHPTDRIAHITAFPLMEKLVGMRNSSMSSPQGIDRTTHHAMSGRSTTELHLAPSTIESYITNLTDQMVTIQLKAGENKTSFNTCIFESPPPPIPNVVVYFFFFFFCFDVHSTRLTSLSSVCGALSEMFFLSALLRCVLPFRLSAQCSKFEFLTLPLSCFCTAYLRHACSSFLKEW